MSIPTASLFFSLDKTTHKLLWELETPVWQALHRLKEYLASLYLGEIQIQIPPNIYLTHSKQISIGKGTIIEPGVMIQGPCVIGDHCILRHGAYIREHVILGDHTVVGHSAEIKHSIVLNFSSVTHFCYVGDSIIGNHVNLGAGVKCANLRLDRKEVQIRWENMKLTSGLKKFGAVIGDGTQIGCNCVLNPGTLIGRGSLLNPLLNLGGTIPPNSCMKGKKSMLIEALDS